jgi:hypothetical protein
MLRERSPTPELRLEALGEQTGGPDAPRAFADPRASLGLPGRGDSPVRRWHRGDPALERVEVAG